MNKFTSGVEKHVFSKTHRSLGGPGVTICLAGMQSHGVDQFASIAYCLPGQVRAYNAYGRRFRPDLIVARATADVRDHVGEPIRVFGASQGGMLTPFLMRELRKYHDPDLLEAVIVDAPSGLKSIANPRAFLLGSSAMVNAFSALPSCIKAPVIVPPWNHISVPPDMPTNHDNYRWQVQRGARQRLAGFPISLWAEKIHWMIHVSRSGSLARACQSHDGIRTTYIQCLLHNLVVKPSAARDWQSWIDLTLLDVQAAHCAFSQNNWEFVQLLQSEYFDTWHTS